MIVTRCLTVEDTLKIVDLYWALGQEIGEPDLAVDWLATCAFTVPEYKILGFIHEGVLVGFLDFLIKAKTSTCLVVNTYVLPEFRHRSATLFRTGLQYVSAMEYSSLSVVVSPGREAIWMKHQFVPETLVLTREV